MRRELVVWGFCQILRQSGLEDGAKCIWQQPPEFTQNLRWRHEDKLIERPRYARALDLTDDQRDEFLLLGLVRVVTWFGAVPAGIGAFMHASWSVSPNVAAFHMQARCLEARNGPETALLIAFDKACTSAIDDDEPEFGHFHDIILKTGRCALAIFVSNVLAKRRLGRALLAVPRRFLDESGPELAQVLREHHGNLYRGAAVDVLR